MLQNFIFIDISTHSHIPCHCEAHSMWAPYIRSLGICFFMYKNLSSWFKRYKLPVQCTLTQDALYASPRWDPYRSHIVTFVYTIKKIYITENLQQKMLVTVWCCYYSNIDLNLLTCVIQNYIKTFHFMMELRVTSTWSTCWKYDHLFVNKLPVKTAVDSTMH